MVFVAQPGYNRNTPPGNARRWVETMLTHPAKLAIAVRSTCGTQDLRSTRGQSDLGCPLDVALALFMAEHHITENAGVQEPGESL